MRDLSASGGGRGVASQVALWAVDQGVLSLTGFRTPDLLRTLEGEPGVGPSLRTSLTLLPWRTPPAVRPGDGIMAGYRSRLPAHLWSPATSADTGVVENLGVVQIGAVLSAFTSNGPTVFSALVTGDGERSMSASDIALRSDFRLTAFYVGSAVTDAQGIATVQAKLPDNITTFRLMATAVSGANRFGSGEATLLATRPVVVRAALPRFVRLGDSLGLGASVNLRDRPSATVQLGAAVTGGEHRPATGSVRSRLPIRRALSLDLA